MERGGDRPGREKVGEVAVRPEGERVKLGRSQRESEWVGGLKESER